MTRNIAETLIGAVVLLVAAGFLFFAYDRSNMKAVDGYQIAAKFTAVGSLKAGADVRVSGIRIGSVISQEIQPESFLALVNMSIDPPSTCPKTLSRRFRRTASWAIPISSWSRAVPTRRCRRAPSSPTPHRRPICSG